MHLKDHLLWGFLYWSVADAGVWGEKVYRDVTTSCVWLSSCTLPPRLPFFPPKAFPTILSSLLFPCTTSLQPTVVYLGIALLSLSSSQSLHILVNLSGVHRATAQIAWLSFLQAVTDLLLHSLTASSASFLSRLIALMWGFHPCFSSSTPGCRSILTHSPPLFLCFLYLANFFMDLYITFWRSGTPAISQVVFCKIFCIGRSSPDASMERGVLHFHLLVCNLWLSILNIVTYTCQSKMSIVFILYELNL